MLVGVFACATGLGGYLKLKIVEEEAFAVIGIEERTNNAREMTPDGAIPRLWDRLFKEGILDRIPHRAAMDIIVIYTDYASDRKGDYTYILGARVNHLSRVPQGMVAKTVQKARYAVLTTEKGPVGKVVSGAWQEIWRLEDRGELGGKRAYRADFELYDERSRDPQNSQVDIYVGIGDE